MGRRDNKDKRWRSLKEKISKRDKNTCRLVRILTAQEFYLLLKKAPKKLIERLDHAHIFGVGSFPHMCYNDLNVVLLNRYSHENLDNCKDPLTGENITKEDRDEWWKRIVGENIFRDLEECSYRNTCEEEEDVDEKIILDGQEVTKEKLQEEMSRKDIRIVEVSPGVYKTLIKLQE